jgi:hypothetical protein
VPSDDPQRRDDVLVGRRAVEWLFARPNGGHFFDGSLIGVQESFGRQAQVSALAPLGLAVEATDFFFGVTGHVEHDEDWERLVRAHVSLLGASNRLATRRTRRATDPFERFHLSLLSLCFQQKALIGHSSSNTLSMLVVVRDVRLEMVPRCVMWALSERRGVTAKPEVRQQLAEGGVVRSTHGTARLGFWWVLTTG